MAQHDWDDTGQPWLDDWSILTDSTLLAVTPDDVLQVARSACKCDAEVAAELEGLIRTSQKWLEERFDIVIFDSTFQFVFRGWPIRHQLNPSYTGANLFLPRRPVRTIEEIRYYDEDEVQQTWASGNYRATFRSMRRRSDVQVTVATGWPKLGNRFNRVEVDAKCGVLTAAEVDWRIKRFITLHAAHSFRSGRDAVSDRMPHDMKWSLRDVEALLEYGAIAGVAS